MRQQMRIGAYGLVLDAGQILLCRISERLPALAGQWTLPGGGLEFGEHPADAMIREVFEETGLHVRPTGLAGVDSIVRDSDGLSYQSIRIVYYTELLGGTLTDEQDGSTDLCQWWTKERLHAVPMLDLAHKALVWIG